jgi:(p)ppGpp synthase/HD superfamily hydrolase
MSYIIQAAQYACRAHSGVKRKYNGEPYISHPARTAARIMLVPDCGERQACAMWMHDIKEDCPKFWPIPAVFEPGIVKLIEEVSNPSKNFTGLPRAEAKQMDRDHIAKASYWGKVMKCIDRHDNLLDMDLAPLKFKKIYLEESLLLAQVLDSLEPDLNKLVGDLYETIERLSNQLKRAA